MSLNIEIGGRIRNERERLHLTREALAEKLNLSYSFLSDLERGKSGPGLENLMVIAQFFGFSTDYLLGMPQMDDFWPITRHLHDFTREELAALEPLIVAAATLVKSQISADIGDTLEV